MIVQKTWLLMYIYMFCLMMVLLLDIYSAIIMTVGREYGGPRIIKPGMPLLVNNKQTVSNYRPISIITFFSKVIETICIPQ